MNRRDSEPAKSALRRLSLMAACFLCLQFAAIAPEALAGTSTAPTIVGTPGLAGGQIDEAGWIPVGVSWIPPQNVGSGLGTYEFQRATGDCQTWARVATISAPGTTSAVVPIPSAPIKGTCLRMRAVDTNGHPGVWTSTSIGKLVVYNETQTTADAQSTRILFQGGWPRVAQTGAVGDYVKWSQSSAAKATFEFRGTSVAVVTDKISGHGGFYLTIDTNPVDANPGSVPIDPFSTNSATTQTRVVIWSRNNLSAGDLHILELRPRGDARIDLDAFVVRR